MHLLEGEQDGLILILEYFWGVHLLSKRVTWSEIL